MKLSETLSTGRSGEMRMSALNLTSFSGVPEQLAIIHQNWPDIENAGLVDVDPEELCTEITNRIGVGGGGDDGGGDAGNWDGVSWVKICQTVRALWEGNLWGEENYACLRDFLNELAFTQPRSYLIRTFYNVYLETFALESRRSEALAKLLKHTHKHLSSSVSELANDFDLFNPSEAPSSISYLMLDTALPYQELKKLGIPAPHSKGLMLESHVEYLKRLAGPIERSDPETIRALFEWMKPDGISSPFDLAAIPTINALLSPWKDADPDEELQNLILDNLISMFGDPRLVKSGPWMVIDPEFEQIIMRWLTKANLIAFLDIVSGVIRDEKDFHMWPNRRKFWEKQWDKGRIDAAWVALSDAGRNEALYLAKQSGSKGLMAFADVHVRESDKGKCFLFLKCGNKIVVEGSHNFRVHIFDPAQETCPKLFQYPHKGTKTYSNFRSRYGYPIDEIRYGNPKYDPITHDAGGRWMEKVERVLLS